MRANTIRERAYKQGRNNGAVLDNKTYEILQRISTIVEAPRTREDGPEPIIDKGLYLDEASKELRYYDQEQDKWISVFKEHFQITTEMLTENPTDNPVYGQLWINEGGFLFFYNGIEWTPMKTLQQDGNDINLSIFEDFLMLSPMESTGSHITENASKEQFLVPRIKTGRMFVEGVLSEKYDAVNKVTVQVDTEAIPKQALSWVHVNPGKLTNIKKTLFAINRTSHFIPHTAHNTEFYGFRFESHGGKLLRPNIDFMPRKDGVILTEKKAVAYDFVLAINYEFGWFRTTGSVKVLDETAKNTFAAIGLSGGVSVFVDGYQIDPEQYNYDSINDYVEITDPDFDQESQEVMVISNVSLTESGIIRAHFRHDYAVIRLRNEYKNPLLFINGEALHEGSDAGEFIYDREQNRMLVSGASTSMGYSVIDLVTPGTNEQPEIDAFVSSGFTVINEVDGLGGIPVDKEFNIDNAVLFIEGSAIPKENLEVIGDEVKYLIASDEEGNALTEDMRYILLNDAFNRLYTSTENRNLVHTNSADHVIVYEDNLLRLDRDFLLTVDELNEEPVDGKIIGIYQEDESIVYKKYSITTRTWSVVNSQESAYIENVTNYYQRAPRSVIFNREGDMNNVRIYAYQLASQTQNPLIVGRFDRIEGPDLLESVDADKEQNFHGEDTFYFDRHISYPPNKNALQVFVDGLRIYDVEEMPLGNGFILPEKVVGVVSYIIEKPLPGEGKSCEREVLTYENALDGANIYKTEQPLYPGNLTVYVGGLRQPKESYVIIDHHTIMFKDSTRKLIGSGNYPTMDVYGYDKKLHEMPVAFADEILIENRQTRIRNEDSIILKDWAESISIDIEEAGLSKEIIDAKDHLLFFLDGRFMSLRWNKEDYEILNGIGKILIHDLLYKLSIEDNPLLKMLEEDEEVAKMYTELTGKTIEDFDRSHVLTIEWR